MTTSTPSSPSRYHHGDLRATLLDAAERMVDAGSVRELSLRELAREAGVSHAAPYRHFPDRDALVRALAERWMTDFVRRQRDAASTGEPAANLIAAGSAYIAWAVEHPLRFAVVFDPAINRGADETAFGHLVSEHTELLGALVGAAVESGAVAGAVAPAAVRLWGTVHGLATLAILGLVDVDSARDSLVSAVR